MHCIDLSFLSPAENLAADEALAQWCEAQDTEALRFWESQTPFVVVGYANKIATEVNAPACEAQGVPIHRRASGGGTVVQGPGCLNYTLILRIPEGGPLASVTGTNEFIMQRNAEAIGQLLGQEVTVCGHTDLAIEGRKFSGNAQRRYRTHILFHGTLLLDFDLPLISQLLRSPSLQPEYRANRDHRKFLLNLHVSGKEVKATLSRAWQAEAEIKLDLSAWIPRLVEEKYGNAEWNQKF